MSALRGRAARQARAGTALAIALAFAGTALVLAWIAVHSLYIGRFAGSPRRTVFAMLSLVLATVVLGLSLAVALRALFRRRLLSRYLRPGERIAGVFPAELLRSDDRGAVLGSDSIWLTLTNQRLMVHRPESNPDPEMGLEHEEIVAIQDQGPTECPGPWRCLMQVMTLSNGAELQIRMNASTALDFQAPRNRYLIPTSRQMRALVVETRGPTPSRPSQPLATMLVNGEPTVCLLELDENYLRIVGEHSPPMADLYYYFHWEHMSASELAPAKLQGVPTSWRRLRLVFHESSSIVLCGTPSAMRRLRSEALTAGATPLQGERPSNGTP